MDALKTYEQVNRADKSLSFGISKMEETYARKKGKTDVPHRHNFYTVILTKEAKGKHLIDFQEYQLSPGQIYFIAPGQVHQLIEEAPSVGFAMVFSNDFLARNNIPISFIENLNLFHDFAIAPPLVLGEKEREQVDEHLDEIYQLHHSELKFKDEAIGSLLKLILIYCNNSCTLPPSSSTENDLLLSQFKNLINQHYKELHSTQAYAEKLHISADHLNRVVKSQTGKTAKEHIQSRITVAAKRLLFFSSLSNKEIGYELGFSEPANFSAFFKKCVGLSPSDFRKTA
jgi:AraC-like DNA-binding protein